MAGGIMNVAELKVQGQYFLPPVSYPRGSREEMVHSATCGETCGGSNPKMS